MLSIATLMFLVSVEPPLKPEHDKLFGAAVARNYVWRVYAVEALCLCLITADFALQLRFYGVRCLWHPVLRVAGRTAKNQHMRIRQLHATLLLLLWISFGLRAFVPVDQRQWCIVSDVWQNASREPQVQ